MPETPAMPVISKSAARRYLLQRVGLGAADPWRAALRGTEGTLAALKRLENIQIDPVNVLARNQALAVAQRVDRPEGGLDGLLAGGQVFEYACGARFVYPIEDYPFFRVRMREMATRWADRLKTVESAANAVLARLAAEGPLPSRALDSGERVRGWWDSDAVTKATRHALDLLEDSGLVTTVRREGQERYFGLPETVFAPELLARSETVTAGEWRDFIVAKYFRAHVLAQASDSRFGWIGLKAAERTRLLDLWCESGRLRQLHVEGVRRPYYALADDAEGLLAMAGASDSGETDGPVSIIPPLDNLLFQRVRLVDLFDFAYTWEVYVPPAKRRYGPYTMPLLAGERLIGRINARHDREAGALTVSILEFEPWLKPGRRLQHAVRDAIGRLALSVGAGAVRVSSRDRVEMSLE